MSGGARASLSGMYDCEGLLSVVGLLIEVWTLRVPALGSYSLFGKVCSVQGGYVNSRKWTFEIFYRKGFKRVV